MKKKSPNTQVFSHFQISVATFFVALLVLVVLLMFFMQIRNSMQKQEIKYLAVNTSNKITKVITDLIWKTETLSALISQGKGEIQDFDKIAAILVNHSSIRNVSIAPGGVVSRIYPLQGNESVIGLDLLGSGGSKETTLAKDTGKLTLAGPFKLVQGGEALTGRLPVYMSDKDGRRQFWGFVAIALDYPKVLDYAYLDDLYQQGYSCEIWRTSPDTGKKQVIWRSHEGSGLADPETQEIQLFNVTWHVSIAKVDDIYSKMRPWAYLVAGVFISLLISLVSYHYLELRKVKAAMEDMAMTDTLTGLPNRRQILSELEEAVSKSDTSGNEFTLAYLDLNDFKAVNDSQGHEAGDRVLVESASIIKRCVGPENTVARVGGDEFIVLLRNVGPGEQLDEIVRMLMERVNIPVYVKGKSDIIRVTTSVGTAVWPRDGRDAQSLLHHADQRMYEMKRGSR